MEVVTTIEPHASLAMALWLGQSNHIHHNPQREINGGSFFSIELIWHYQ